VGGDFRLGEWLVQPSQNSVSRSGASIHLEPKVMEVLVCLADKPGATVPKEDLLKNVWPDTFVTDDGLIRSISELRRVFEDDARQPRFIQTIPKRGYCLVAPVLPTNGVGALATQATPSPVVIEELKSGNRRVWMLAIGITASVLISALVISLRIRRPDSGGVPPIHSLAVLPLQNLSADSAQEYFSDGMTDALITDLAQIGSMKVISRTSSMQYKNTKKSLPEIARELNVDGIIEGTVQRSGERVRITAQLIHGPSDKHLWANSYERELRDVFVLERDVTDDIARQVQARISVTGQTEARLSRPVDPKVLDAYVQGEYHLKGRGRGAGDEEPKKAREYFQRAIDLDPNFAPAYVGLALAHDTLSQGEPDDLVIVRRLAEKAIELDPASSDAHAELGQAMAEAWDWKGWEGEYRRAIALNPNNADAHSCLGGVLDITGRLDEGWKEIEIAQELDPNQDYLADPLDERGHVDQAIEIRNRIATRDPLHGYNRYALAMYYAEKQMFKEFTAEMGKATTLFGFPDVAGRLQHAYDQSSGQGVLRQWARELEQLAAAKRLYMPGELARLYASFGDKDRAFYWLEQFRQHHDVATANPPIYFKTDPWLAPLHSDPRFSDFLRRVGLPQ